MFKFKKMLLSSALLLAALLAAGQAAPQATEASVCVVNGRPKNVPMAFCGGR